MTDKYRFYKLRIHLIIAVLMLFSISNGFGQSDNGQRDINDSIRLYSEVLTGKWELIGFYKNNQFVETLISTSFSTKSDGLKEEKILTDTGLICKRYIHDTLISIEKLDSKDVIDLEFNSNGRGSYQHYSDYAPKSDIQIFETCQPIPKILYRKGKYVINFVSMGGEYDTDFEIKEDSLRLGDANDKKKLYLRIKE